MNQMTKDSELNQFVKQVKQIQYLLQVAISQFQMADDVKGIESLLEILKQIDNLIDIHQNLSESQIDINDLLSKMKKLYSYMKNEDITGVIDLLEYSFYPMTEKWLIGGEVCENS